MGYSVSAAFSILVVASVLSLTYLYNSFDQAVDRIEKGVTNNFGDLFTSYNSGIDVVNVSTTASGGSYDLEIIVLNTGSETLDARDYTYLEGGSIISYTTLSDNYHLPDKNITVTFTDISGTGSRRLKVVTDHGNSAYETYVVS